MFDSTVQSDKDSAQLRRPKQLAAVTVAIGIGIMLVAACMYYVGLSAHGSTQSNDYGAAVPRAVVRLMVL